MCCASLLRREAEARTMVGHYFSQDARMHFILCRAGLFRRPYWLLVRPSRNENEGPRPFIYTTFSYRSLQKSALHRRHYRTNAMRASALYNGHAEYNLCHEDESMGALDFVRAA